MDTMFNDVIEGVVNIFMDGNRTTEIKKRLIDPLIGYYRTRIIFAYFILCVLSIIIVVTNIYIIYKINKSFNYLSAIRSSLSVVG